MTTGSLFGQLDMGKRALMAQQSGMNTAGHNIANINNENFSRQRLDLDPQHPNRSRFGAGVDIKSVERIADRFLTKRVQEEQSRTGETELAERGLKRLEAMFAEIEGFGLRDALNEFWGAWGRLANKPEAEIYRKDLINVSKTLATRINSLGRDFNNMRVELNGRISEKVERVNQLTGQIANLNTRIQQTDREHGEGNDLKDERDAAIKELSRLIQINWVEKDDKTVQIAAGNGFPLVVGRNANKVEASFKHDEIGFFSLRGIDPKGISRDLTRELRSGELKALVTMRDETLVHFDNQLNELASELAFQANRVHNSGTGLMASYDRLTSSFALKPDAVDRPLPFLKDGMFRFHLVNKEGEMLETYEMDMVAGQDTVKSIVERINLTVANPKLFQAELNQDGSVSLNTKGPYRFILGEDETDFSVIMGFNNFFETLHGAKDFRVNERLMENPAQITTGQHLLPGDNSKALEMAQLQFKPTMEGSAITFDEFYNGMLAELGVMINRSSEESRNQRIMADQFQKLRDEVSSVNMDEEVAEMVQYQRGFEAAAKFIGTVDEMTQTVINM